MKSLKRSKDDAIASHGAKEGDQHKSKEEHHPMLG
jgi:hypothetical protein